VERLQQRNLRVQVAKETMEGSEYDLAFMEEISGKKGFQEFKGLAEKGDVLGAFEALHDMTVSAAPGYIPGAGPRTGDFDMSKMTEEDVRRYTGAIKLYGDEDKLTKAFEKLDVSFVGGRLGGKGWRDELRKEYLGDEFKDVDDKALDYFVKMRAAKTVEDREAIISSIDDDDLKKLVMKMDALQARTAEQLSPTYTGEPTLVGELAYMRGEITEEQ